MTLPFDRSIENMQQPASTPQPSSSLSPIAAYCAIVDECIELFEKENAHIKSHDLSEEGRLYSEGLVAQKKIKTDALEAIFETLKTYMEDKNASKEQLLALKFKQAHFARATAENFAYLQLAETLNQRMLGLFININAASEKHFYNATGMECPQKMPIAAAFLSQSA